MTTTHTTSFTTTRYGMAPSTRQDVGRYVSAQTTTRNAGRYTDTETPRPTARQHIVSALKTLRDPAPASGRVSGHGQIH